MRGKPAPKRKINADPRFNDVAIAKFINYVMHGGKKTTAQKVVYAAFDLVGEKSKRDAMEVFEEALKNITPSMEVRGRRVGGANYQVPYPVRGERRNMLAFRWLLAAARARRGRPMPERLAAEILDAAGGQGAAVKKRQDTYRMAEANRAFAGFAIRRSTSSSSTRGGLRRS